MRNRQFARLFERVHPWLAIILISLGVALFLLSFYPNMVLHNTRVGDLCELLGTAGIVFGANIFVRHLSRSAYVTGLFLAGCFLLAFARLVDFTEELSIFADAAVLGPEGFGHLVALRLSESAGYICLLLTMLVLMHDQAQLARAAAEESSRYRSLHEASQYLARVADMTADAVFAVNDIGGVQVWNRGAERLFGYSKDQALGLSLRDVLTFGLEPMPNGVVAWASARTAQNEVDVTGRRQDGSLFAAGASFSPISGDDGKHIGVSVVVRDIEQRMQEVREVTSARKLLSGALQAADVGLFVLDRRGGIIEFNARMQELTGLAPESIAESTFEAIAKTALDTPDTLLNTAFERVLKHGKHVELRNLRVKRPDGTVRVCNGAVAPVMDEHGEIIAAAGVAVDTTEREALQNRLLEAQKMDSIGRLAGGIAHDFNNILTGVLGYATLAKQAVPAESPVMKHLMHIEESAVRASELTHQLLTFARGGTKHEVKLSVNPIIEETVKLVAHSLDPNVRITFVPQADVDQISGDPSQIHQMLMNLCLNARDAITCAGEIRLSAENVDTTQEQVEELQLAAPGRYVRIRVEDTGKGMSPEVCRRIFEPFFSTKRQGHGYGLGLSVVYGIVRSHRGAITVDSVLGRGSTFDVFLPSAGSPAPEHKDNGNGAVVKRDRETILVVDDEQLLRAVLQDILEMAGYNVLQASTGEEAIEIYRQHQSDIAVVIMDVVMPGMGGAKALDELYKLNPSLRCVVSSGFGDETIGDKHSHRQLRFVPKPFSTVNVTTAVQELLRT